MEMAPALKQNKEMQRCRLDIQTRKHLGDNLIIFTQYQCRILTISYYMEAHMGYSVLTYCNIFAYSSTVRLKCIVLRLLVRTNLSNKVRRINLNAAVMVL